MPSPFQSPTTGTPTGGITGAAAAVFLSTKLKLAALVVLTLATLVATWHLLPERGATEISPLVKSDPDPEADEQALAVPVPADEWIATDEVEKIVELPLTGAEVDALKTSAADVEAGIKELG